MRPAPVIHLSASGSIGATSIGASATGGGAFLALLARPVWMRDALCLEHPEVSWFPDRGEPSAAAVAICAGCLVRQECAQAGEG